MGHGFTRGQAILVVIPATVRATLRVILDTVIDLLPDARMRNRTKKEHARIPSARRNHACTRQPTTSAANTPLSEQGLAAQDAGANGAPKFVALPRPSAWRKWQAGGVGALKAGLARLSSLSKKSMASCVTRCWFSGWMNRCHGLREYLPSQAALSPPRRGLGPAPERALESGAEQYFPTVPPKVVCSNGA